MLEEKGGRWTGWWWGSVYTCACVWHVCAHTGTGRFWEENTSAPISHQTHAQTNPCALTWACALALTWGSPCQLFFSPQGQLIGHYSIRLFKLLSFLPPSHLPPLSQLVHLTVWLTFTDYMSHVFSWGWIYHSSQPQNKHTISHILKAGFHFTTRPIEGDPDALSSPLVIVLKKIERASPVPRLRPSRGGSTWGLWWWRRLSLSSCCDTLFSSFSTNWARPCWFCLKLEGKNTRSNILHENTLHEGISAVCEGWVQNTPAAAG